MVLAHVSVRDQGVAGDHVTARALRSPNLDRARDELRRDDPRVRSDREANQLKDMRGQVTEPRDKAPVNILSVGHKCVTAPA